MIVPMKKVSLIIMGDKKEEALKTLRSLGLVHIEISQGSGKRLAALSEQEKLLCDAIFTLGKNKSVQQKAADTKRALELAARIAQLTEMKTQYQSEQAALNELLDSLKDWGEIDTALISELAEKGVRLSFYEMPKSDYNALPDSVKTVRLNSGKKSVKFMLEDADSLTADEQANLKSFRLALPSQSTAELRQRLGELDNSLNAANEELSSYSCYAKAFSDAVKEINREIEFETYATGMETESLSSDSGKTLSVAYFKGYIEEKNLEKLQKAARENSWGLLSEEPCPEDDVPTKLSNNKFVSLIYPLTDFLGTVPGYFEYDISGWFLAFILIFFGIIFGDGGYGLIILAAAAAAAIKALISKKSISPTVLLIGLFGLSTVLWGTLTCTWFGLSPEQLPSWLKALSVPVISNVYADKIWHLPWTATSVGLTTAQNLQIFCFTLALVQLTVAHVKGALRNRKSVKMLGDVGSVMQLFGMYYLVLSLVVNPQVFTFSLVLNGIPVGTAAIALIGVGFLLSFVFSNYEGSILSSVTASLKNIVSVLLGVVNVFSDIVSYIRLWAVGLAGAAISATVNELAGPLLGNFMFMIVAIVLLVFGHGLNMILNVLSVIVHGIRLNTLEFSSHLDMSWSGHKFKPFEE